MKSNQTMTVTNQVIFRKLIVRVIDITVEGAEPPRRLYQLRVHQFSKCFVSWPNQKLEFPPVPVSFQKCIASSGIVLISFIKNGTFMFYCSPLPNVSDKPICLCQNTAKI